MGVVCLYAVIAWLVHCCLVGALLALASGKAERRQVHPLKLKSVGELSQKLSDYEKKRNFALIARR